VINSLRFRLISVVLIINAALVPLLYIGVSAIVEEGYAEQFVNGVRSFSRLTADELEAAGDADFAQRGALLLDDAMLTGQVVYTEIVDGARKMHSSIDANTERARSRDDFAFGDQGDQVYYISQSIKRGNHPVLLRLGFDESPTLERIAAAKRRILMAVLTFTVVSVLVSIWLSTVIVRPMVRLREAAQRVAGGDVNARLQMSSSIAEVKELNHHLESMRQALVGANERLASEMREREVSEKKRLELERQLLHRERIATVGTLAGGVAHEFNNILTPILLYSQLALNESPADAPRSRDLRRIVSAAHRARSLITRILTFSRQIDSQGTTQFSVQSTVDEALALLRAIVPANIEIAMQGCAQEMILNGDPSLVHQVVINLCTNGYQAMAGVGGRLRISLSHATSDSVLPIGAVQAALLEVSDTGHGIEPSAVPHIFEPFYTTREVGEGTGLGLSVVHGIVTSMGGAITVESTVGIGTTFRVYFPLAVGSA
jgi:signal transduction histidine kinase